MNRLRVDLFVEDRAHEEFLKVLALRVAREEGAPFVLRVRSAKGGHPRALREYQVYQRLVERGGVIEPPNLLIVGIDGNCKTFQKAKQEILEATYDRWQEGVVVACPDPHIERWYLADPESFFEVVGYRPAIAQKKCKRDYYKQSLAQAVRQGGHPATLGGIEFAPELVDSMDFYRAGHNDRSLKAFVDDFRNAVRRYVPHRT